MIKPRICVNYCQNNKSVMNLIMNKSLSLLFFCHLPNYFGPAIQCFFYIYHVTAYCRYSPSTINSLDSFSGRLEWKGSRCKKFIRYKVWRWNYSLFLIFFFHGPGVQLHFSTLDQSKLINISPDISFSKLTTQIYNNTNFKD